MNGLKVENERLRGLLQQAIEMIEEQELHIAAEMLPAGRVLVEEIKAALSQQAEQQWPTAYPHEAMDKMAADRYRVGAAGAGTLHRFAVRAGDGEQELYRGSESDCQNVARKLAGAFLDGGFAFQAMLAAPIAQTAPAPWQEATGRAAFKNFHRSLCERFGYMHDEEFWWRDQISLEEHIAKLAAPQPEQIGLVEVLREVAASLAWNCFGECRAIHDGPIMPAARALEMARAALSAQGESHE